MFRDVHWVVPGQRDAVSRAECSPHSHFEMSLQTKFISWNRITFVEAATARTHQAQTLVSFLQGGGKQGRDVLASRILEGCQLVLIHGLT